ncbi:tail fiber assembly protein [Pseudomonas sp. H3_G09]
MAIYARVENGVVVERIDTGEYAISQLFAPSFVDTMVRVLDGQEVEIGAPISGLPTVAGELPAQQSRVIAQAPIVAEEEPAMAARVWRQASLATNEWLVSRHRDEQDLGRGTSLKPTQYLELLEYRQALRDWPDSALFPALNARPLAPAWLAIKTGEQ